MPSDSTEVTLKAQVPRVLYERWTKLYPFHGVTTFVFTEVLQQMCNDGSPEAIDKVRAAVREMLRTNRGK